MLYVLLILSVVSGFHCQLLVQEQLDDFVDSLLESSVLLQSGRRVLAGLELRSPFLSVGFQNATLRGPSSLKRSDPVKGTQTSGTALIVAELSLGRIQLDYSRIQLQILRLTFSTDAVLAIIDAQAVLVIRIDRSTMDSCQVTVTTTPPTGKFIFSLGRSGGFLQMIIDLLELLIPESYLPYSLLRYLFYPHISGELERNFLRVARQLACGPWINLIRRCYLSLKEWRQQLLSTVNWWMMSYCEEDKSMRRNFYFFDTIFYTNNKFWNFFIFNWIQFIFYTLFNYILYSHPSFLSAAETAEKYLIMCLFLFSIPISMWFGSKSSVRYYLSMKMKNDWME